MLRRLNMISNLPKFAAKIERHGQQTDRKHERNTNPTQPNHPTTNFGYPLQSTPNNPPKNKKVCKNKMKHKRHSKKHSNKLKKTKQNPSIGESAAPSNGKGLSPLRRPRRAAEAAEAAARAGGGRCCSERTLSAFGCVGRVGRSGNFSS